MKGFTAQAKEEASLDCRMPGCRNRWTCDVNHGRVCSHHDEVLSRSGRPSAPEKARQTPQAAIPFADVARPFCEPAEPDEEYVHHD